MVKKVVIIACFVLFFISGIALMLKLQNGSANIKVEKIVEVETPKVVENSDGVNVYKVEDLQSDCSSQDKIFCAVEKVVKCTLSPDLDGCDKDVVPAFILGKTDDVERPTEISFKISMLKPIPESKDISVYTESDCNALWFGLCKGTVIYSLTPRENDDWAVTSVFAIE